MPDRCFSDPRLAAIYDAVDGDRDDLDHYVAIADDVRARSMLDVGCGTGTFACLMACRPLEVTGVDPAAASLDIARAKPGADVVRWILGDATTLPPLQVDLAVMTGNVAQVFLTDDDWCATLRGVRHALRPGGHLVFEVRDPSIRAWEAWNRESSRATVMTSYGPVDHWIDVTAVDLPLISFRSTYRFLDERTTLTSDSTLRFRNHDEITASLTTTGFTVDDVRDAPDRPNKELVFIAHRDA